ncbi:MAG TPA: zinc ribbon domain-containing protein [Candidatus Limnocylindrales bacterium]|nr:zinc ribbon domain-containing protein [Candidatus Limnocylindrales bacterium]
MDQIFQTIGDAVGSIFDNPVVKLGGELILAYWVVLWLAAAYWAFRDMQGRSDNAIAPYLAATFIIVFTPILFPLAVFTYRIVRPQERIGDVYERNLAEEAMLAEIEAIPHCPSCDRRVDPNWIICPSCRTRLNRVCPNCNRLVGLDWSLCAWCGRDFERHDAIAAAAAAPIVSLPQREALPAGEIESIGSRIRTSVRGAARAADLPER